jgi:hypothetical protein
MLYTSFQLMVSQILLERSRGSIFVLLRWRRSLNSYCSRSRLLQVVTVHRSQTQCLIASLSIVNRVTRRKVRVQTKAGPMTFDAGGEAAI